MLASGGPLLVLLCLVVLAGQSSSVPDVTVVLQGSDVVLVTVRPPRQRTVKTILLQPGPSDRAPKPTPVQPRAVEALPKGSVQAIFDRPLATFHVVVTLDDSSTRSSPPFATCHRRIR